MIKYDICNICSYFMVANINHLISCYYYMVRLFYTEERHFPYSLWRLEANSQMLDEEIVFYHLVFRVAVTVLKRGRFLFFRASQTISNHKQTKSPSLQEQSFSKIDYSSKKLKKKLSVGFHDFNSLFGPRRFGDIMGFFK